MDTEKEHKKKKQSLYLRTFRLLIIGKKHFFFYQLLYGVIMFLCLVPLVQALSNLSTRFAGFSYVTTENLIPFMTKPATILSVLIFLFVFGFLLEVEISFVMSFLLVSKKVEKRLSIFIFLGCFRKAFHCLKRKNFGSMFLAYVMLLVSSITVIAGICLRGRIPKYFIKSIHNDKLVWVISGILLALLLLLFIKCIFTLPYVLLENKGIRESQKSGVSLVKNHRLYMAVCVLGWNLCVIAISVILYGIIIAVEALFVILFVDKSTAVAVFLTLYDHANLYAALGLTWFGLYCNLGLVVELFLKFKKINDEEFQASKIKLHTKLLTNKRKRVIATVIAAVFLLVDGTYTYLTIRSGSGSILSGMAGITITAHRGSSSDAPENTLPAIEAAINNTADVAEIDVQETKDGMVVVLHDTSLKRTSGYDEFIWNMTFDEVRQLDMGSWFSEEFAGTQIPTLEEVLQSAKGRIKLNIEIKASTHFTDLEEKVVDLIEEYDFVNQCVVQSVNYESLEKVKELNPDIKTGYILMAAYGDFDDKGAVDFFSIRSSFVNKKMVESAHQNGKEVYAWTVNTKNEIRRMKVLKVDNIITDRPVLARELIYQDSFDSSFQSLFKLLKL